MDKPDFAKYSDSQLRQILTRIDRERFPERVEEIQARLAQIEAERLARPQIDQPASHHGPPEIAGFWRRAGAFLIDYLLLGLIGFILGLVLHDQFEAMGGWVRIVGFLIEVAYFSVMESRIFQGCTLGKRALDIQVVTTAGVPLGVGHALLRSTVFWVPYFLNNANVANDYTDIVLPTIQGLLVFGLGGAIVYLCVFNRRTRQSVHDLLVGVVVVRARREAAPTILPLWRGHMAVVVVLFAVLIGLIGYARSLLGASHLQSLASVQQQVTRLPDVRNAVVVSGTSFTAGAKSTNLLAITAVTRTAIGDEDKLAHAIADIAFSTYPSARQSETLSVTLTHGYDIGIASKWTSREFNASPSAWQDRRAQNN